MNDVRNEVVFPYTRIENKLAQHKNMSLEALGLFALMSSFPADWQFYLSHLAEQKTSSLYKTRQALTELLELGVVTREHKFDERNKFAGFTYVLVGAAGLVEDPQSHKTVVRNTDIRNTDIGNTDILESHTTKKQNTNKQSINKQNKEKESSRSVRKQAQEIIDTYNEHRGTEPNAMPRVDLLNKGREQRIKQAINDYGFEKVKELMVKACKNRVADPDRFYSRNNHGLDALLADQKFVKYAEAWDHQQTQQQQQAQPEVRLMSHEKKWAYNDAAEEWLALTPDEQNNTTIEELAERNEERMLNAKRNRNQND